MSVAGKSKVRMSFMAAAIAAALVAALAFYAVRHYQLQTTMANYASAECLPPNVDLTGAGTMGWDHTVRLEEGSVAIQVRHVGKGQVVTARYGKESGLGIASKGDLFSTHDLRIDRQHGILFVGFFGGLSADAGYVVQYDLKHRAQLAELAVEPSELRDCQPSTREKGL
jgi:hypothetical protein